MKLTIFIALVRTIIETGFFPHQCMVEEIRWFLPHIGVTVLIHIKRPAVLLTTASTSLCKYQQNKRGKKKC